MPAGLAGTSIPADLDYHSPSYPVVVAAKRAVVATGALSSEIFGVLAGLFQGRISLKQLEGPVGIMRGKARRGGGGRWIFFS